MDNKLTAKQETFCLAYLETGNASEAYRRAYDAGRMKPETVNRNAKALMDNNKIATRLESLRKPVVEAAKLTMGSHLEELQRLKAAAETDGQHAVALRAEELRGRVAGHYVERKEVRAGPLDDLSHDELKKLKDALLASPKCERIPDGN